MKIIDKNDCYVSKDDLFHLFDNDDCMPLSLQQSLRDAIIFDKDYVKITEDRALEYVYTSNIPSFENLAKLKISELKRQIMDITIEEMISDSYGESLSVKEIIRERRNMEYLIKQLKEMIAFKKKYSSISYPDVPYPYMTGITNGYYNASISYNFNTVVIYNLDGSRVEDVDDIEFCKESFKLLTHDVDNEEDLDMKFDGNYFIVKNKARKLKRRRIVD